MFLSWEAIRPRQVSAAVEFARASFAAKLAMKSADRQSQILLPIFF
jgi:hypothetical protein